MTTITDALVTEHRVFLTVFDQVERALPKLDTLAEAKLLGTLVEDLLHGHADAETNLAYAALDHVLEEKGQLDRMNQDHDEIDARLKQVQTARDLAEGRRLLKAALKASREHFRHEEETVFPLIERVLRRETLLSLGEAWRQDHPRTGTPGPRHLPAGRRSAKSPPAKAVSKPR